MGGGKEGVSWGYLASSTGARLVRARARGDSKYLEGFISKSAAQATDARLGPGDAGCEKRPFKAVARVQIPLGPLRRKSMSEGIFGPPNLICGADPWAAFGPRHESTMLHHAQCNSLDDRSTCTLVPLIKNERRKSPVTPTRQGGSTSNFDRRQRTLSSSSPPPLDAVFCNVCRCLSCPPARSHSCSRTSRGRHGSYRGWVTRPTSGCRTTMGGSCAEPSLRGTASRSGPRAIRSSQCS